jgi:hypothetical protein
LKDAGLVTSRVEAQQRIYSISPAPLREVDVWLAPYRARWDEALDRLEAQVALRQRAPRSNTHEESSR